MSNLVIVAIPEENDYVHKISSQPVPHLTLLFLGEVSDEVENLSDIIDFVEHAAKQSLNRFGLEVDRRGDLGDESADVLFFKKSAWSGFPDLNTFRSYLLKDDNIRIAYDSATQFPEWIPHLTLGTSDNPAKPDNRDYPGITYVHFDRIAVWYEEFEGVEFNLDEQEWGAEMAMSQGTELAEDILEHFGTKGMKWGVRKSVDKAFGTRTAGRKPSSYKKPKVHPDIAHIPKKTRKEASKDAEEFTRAKLFFGQGAGVRRRLINAKVEAKKKKDPLYSKAFDHFVKQTDLSKRASQAKSQRRRKDTVSSAKRTAKIVKRIVEPAVVLSLQDSHRKLLNDRGRVTPYYRHDNISERGEEFLEHFGVKGMKWGVRRERSSAVSVTDKRKRIKTSGGHGLPADPSATRARVTGQKAKASGLKALSDEDLAHYAKRLQLEQSVKRLQWHDKPATERFVRRILGQSGSKDVNEAGSDLVKKSIKKVLIPA